VQTQSLGFLDWIRGRSEQPQQRLEDYSLTQHTSDAIKHGVIADSRFKRLEDNQITMLAEIEIVKELCTKGNTHDNQKTMLAEIVQDSNPPSSEKKASP
jgi:hypothetical protein